MYRDLLFLFSDLPFSLTVRTTSSLSSSLQTALGSHEMARRLRIQSAFGAEIVVSRGSLSLFFRRFLTFSDKKVACVVDS